MKQSAVGGEKREHSSVNEERERERVNGGKKVDKCVFLCAKRTLRDKRRE